MKDPIVEEVRKHRKEHTQKFHGELSEICADLRRVQETSGHINAGVKVLENSDFKLLVAM